MPKKFLRISNFYGKHSLGGFEGLSDQLKNRAESGSSPVNCLGPFGKENSVKGANLKSFPKYSQKTPVFSFFIMVYFYNNKQLRSILWEK